MKIFENIEEFAHKYHKKVADTLDTLIEKATK